MKNGGIAKSRGSAKRGGGAKNGRRDNSGRSVKTVRSGTSRESEISAMSGSTMGEGSSHFSFRMRGSTNTVKSVPVYLYQQLVKENASMRDQISNMEKTACLV